jgi:hypothetical protein
MTTKPELSKTYKKSYKEIQKKHSCNSRAQVRINFMSEIGEQTRIRNEAPVSKSAISKTNKGERKE